MDGILHDLAREKRMPLLQDRVEARRGGLNKLTRGGRMSVEEGLMDGEQVTVGHGMLSSEGNCPAGQPLPSYRDALLPTRESWPGTRYGGW